LPVLAASDFKALVQRLLNGLAECGPPIPSASSNWPLVDSRRGLLGRLLGSGQREPSLAERVLYPARDDNFSPTVIDFGKPARATLRVADGHPLFWVRVRDIELRALVEHVAGGLPVEVVSLDWSVL